MPLGGSVWAEVLVVSPDDRISYTWTTDRGGYADNSIGSRVRWIAPGEDDPDVSNLIGFFPTIMVTVEDSLGQRAFGFANVLIADTLETSYSPITFTGNQGGGGCNASAARSSSPAALWFAGLFLVGAAVRRRS